MSVTPRLTVLYAKYGRGGDDVEQMSDVTPVVSKHLSSDARSLSMVVDDEVFHAKKAGPDVLTVSYTTYEGGPELTKAVPQGGAVDIKIAPCLDIKSAIYYTDDERAPNPKTLNVTEKLRGVVSQDGQSITLTVNNETMGGDPAPFRSKVLAVQYRNFEGGPEQQVKVREGTKLNLQADPKDLTTVSPRLAVLSAMYGHPGGLLSDVTSQVSQHLSPDARSLSLAVDPQVFHCSSMAEPSMLVLAYTTFEGGPELTKAVPHGNTVEINITPTLEIKSAVYGAEDGSEAAGQIDVTDKLRSALSPDGQSIQLRVQNDTMGGDPALFRSKCLQVQYVNFKGGPELHVKVREGEQLNLQAVMSE